MVPYGRSRSKGNHDLGGRLRQGRTADAGPAKTAVPQLRTEQPGHRALVATPHFPSRGSFVASCATKEPRDLGRAPRSAPGLCRGPQGGAPRLARRLDERGMLSTAAIADATRGPGSPRRLGGIPEMPQALDGFFTGFDAPVTAPLYPTRPTTTAAPRSSSGSTRPTPSGWPATCRRACGRRATRRPASPGSATTPSPPSAATARRSCSSRPSSRARPTSTAPSSTSTPTGRWPPGASSGVGRRSSPSAA